MGTGFLTSRTQYKSKERQKTFMLPIFNLPFAGDTAFWALLMKSGSVIFEAYGPYQRRTQRTRTTILNPGGPLDISVPVHTGHALLYRDTRINYETDWDRQLAYALQTAYNSSPFFEFMQDDIRRVLDQKHTFLWDFNMAIFNTIAKLININIEVQETTSFCKAAEGQNDFRIAIEPKYSHRLHDECEVIEYNQVFSLPYTDKPFRPYLSIFDLIFNMGPESRDVLRGMVNNK